MQRPCAPKARRPMFGPLCIRPTILPFCVPVLFLYLFCCGSMCSMGSMWAQHSYTSICDGNIYASPYPRNHQPEGLCATFRHKVGKFVLRRIRQTLILSPPHFDRYHPTIQLPSALKSCKKMIFQKRKVDL